MNRKSPTRLKQIFFGFYFSFTQPYLHLYRITHVQSTTKHYATKAASIGLLYACKTHIEIEKKTRTITLQRGKFSSTEISCCIVSQIVYTWMEYQDIAVIRYFKIRKPERKINLAVRKKLHFRPRDCVKYRLDCITKVSKFFSSSHFDTAYIVCVLHPTPPSKLKNCEICSIRTEYEEMV